MFLWLGGYPLVTPFITLSLGCPNITVLEISEPASLLTPDVPEPAFVWKPASEYVDNPSTAGVC